MHYYTYHYLLHNYSVATAPTRPQTGDLGTSTIGIIAGAATLGIIAIVTILLAIICIVKHKSGRKKRFV